MAKELILLVEDDPSAAELLAFLLRGEEYTVVHASDGEAAMNLARSRRPSVILLDLELPRVDGRDVFRVLRADPELASIPVVVVSGADDASDVGANAVIRKPLAKAELLGVLREVFRFAPPSCSSMKMAVPPPVH